MERLDNITIGHIITAPPVQTVIRLEQGRADAASVTSTFVVTAEVAGHLDVLAGLLSKPHGAGCFVQGDFGSGKSHFLAVLAAVFDRSPAAQPIAASQPALGKIAAGPRLLAVDISLVHFRGATPLERIVFSAVETALRRCGHTAALSPLAEFINNLRRFAADPALARDLAAEAGVEPADLGRFFDERPRDAYTAGLRFLERRGLPSPDRLIADRGELFNRAMAAVRDAGFGGMVLLIDELSEFLRSKPDPAALNDDARMLQFLGERSQTEPVWILAALQESVERTGDIAQATLRKIKDRYPFRFHLSTVHIRGLIEQRLAPRADGADQHLLAVFESLRRRFPAFTGDYALFRAVYPLHPETLALLEGLSDLFSQHRGIVDFVHSRIAGDPGRGIESMLCRSCLELLAPDAIYEHFAPRLMEISSMNAYVRHVVPHFDRLIESLFSDEADRRLLMRIVRILVLYAIHPAGRPVTARKLAELVCCALSEDDPEANAQYVAEVLLDPLAAQSGFLTRQAAKSGRAADAAYQISVREDNTKTLRSRIEQRMKDTRPDDSRIARLPLAAFDVPGIWPGGALAADGVETARLWRQSTRRIRAVYVDDETAGEAAGRRIAHDLAAGRIDAAIAFVFGDTAFSCDHTAVWRIRFGAGGAPRPLLEYHAAAALCAELRPSNPAEGPLIPACRDAYERLAPAAREALIELVYAGHFDDEALDMRLEPAARQVRHFERLLDIALQAACERRYPRFAEIAPRCPITVVTLRRILDECIIPGSIPGRQAREKGLAESLEGIAAPLGLIELRGGSYTLSPNPSAHPFLNYLFGLIRPAEPTPLQDVVGELRAGPFGLTADLAVFVLVCLAHSGLLQLRRGGKAAPIDYLRSLSLEGVDSVCAGELLAAADREYLVSQCGFLAPPGEGWSSFGLRHQREAWQTLLKLAPQLRRTVEELSRQVQEAAQYSALRAFDLDAIGRGAAALATVLDEVMTSYGAREGLERFLAAWRASGLSAADIERLKAMNRFFSRSAQEFIYLAHYLKHRSCEAAAAADERLAGLRAVCLGFLQAPETALEDDGERLRRTFEEFRAAYADTYRAAHDAYNRSRRPPAIPRHARRGFDCLRRLAAIDRLEPPQFVQNLFDELDAPAAGICNRDPGETLMRAPVCDCGFAVGDRPPERKRLDPAAAVEQGLSHYLRLLRQPEMIEAIAARAFALADEDKAAARRLTALKTALETDTAAPAAFLDALDDETARDLKAALAGAAPITTRRLADLTAVLAGRRLTKGSILGKVDEWLAAAAETDMILIDGADNGRAPEGAVGPFWWPFVHRSAAAPRPPTVSDAEAEAAAAACEKAFPAQSLAPAFSRLSAAELASFCAEEPVHLGAIEFAWRALAERVLRGDGGREPLAAASRLCSQRHAETLRKRLSVLEKCRALSVRELPLRLTARLAAAEAAHDPWATREMGAAAAAFAESLAAGAAAWLESLPVVTAVDTAGAPVVVVFDAVAADVWIAAFDEARMAGILDYAWARLASAPRTTAALQALFGLAEREDPADILPARGVDYFTVKGSEKAPLTDLCAFSAGRAAVVRINAFDRAAHGKGGMRLHDMPAALAAMLNRHIRPLAALCAAQKRRLIVTADHGVSWNGETLSHGKGDVFEEAVFTASPAASSG